MSHSVHLTYRARLGAARLSSTGLWVACLVFAGWIAVGYAQGCELHQEHALAPSAERLSAEAKIKFIATGSKVLPIETAGASKDH